MNKRYSSKVIVPLMAAALLMVWGTVGCGSDTDKGPDSPKPVQSPPVEGIIVAMGNSLTEGMGLDEESAYPALLAQKLAAAGYTYRVINAGISGETSSGALGRIDWILTLKPDIVILETGANDGMRGVDPDVMMKNIDKIVEKLLENRVIVILAGMRMFHNLGTEFTTRFKAVYTTVAEKHNLRLIPFFLEGVAADPALNLSDGIHPNRKGYERVTDTVFPYVVEAVKEHRALVSGEQR